MPGTYTLHGADACATPSLVYYRDIIRANTEKVIALAGGPGRLWPHVKTHKSVELVRMQQRLGISRFKCATIAEAEMLAQCEAEHVLVAYPLVGTAITRFVRLAATYPLTRFWAIGDSLEPLRQLSGQSSLAGIQTPLLLDLDVGMHRTGVAPDRAEALYEQCAALNDLHVQGFHCYDGHLHQNSPQEREAGVQSWLAILESLEKSLKQRGFQTSVRVLGGSPTFPCLARTATGFLSPGTVFLWDYGYASHFPDIELTPGAALLARVISRPESPTAEGLFTLDLGYKAIGADPTGVRGVIVGMEDAEPIAHSEEHWLFKAGTMPAPAVGTLVYVIPTHICPTSALHASVLVAEEGHIVNSWKVTARSRKLSI